MPSLLSALKCRGRRRCRPAICASVFFCVSNVSLFRRQDLRNTPLRLLYAISAPAGEEGGSTTEVSSSPSTENARRFPWDARPVGC